jgi:hypothetical protein
MPKAIDHFFRKPLGETYITGKAQHFCYAVLNPSVARSVEIFENI